MPGQQVFLPQILEGLGRHFRSVDIRAALAATDPGVWCSLLVCVRISANPPEAIKTRYALLENHFGPRRTPRLKILWEAVPFRRLGQILHRLDAQTLLVERTSITLPRSITLARFAGSMISRYQGDLQSVVAQ